MGVEPTVMFRWRGSRGKWGRSIQSQRFVSFFMVAPVANEHDD